MALLATRQQFRCLEWLGDAGRAGLLEVDREPLDFGAIEKLARKVADQPMDFADASVVLLAARTGVREILTADRRAFARRDASSALGLRPSRGHVGAALGEPEIHGQRRPAAPGDTGRVRAGVEGAGEIEPRLRFSEPRNNCPDYCP